MGANLPYEKRVLLDKVMMHWWEMTWGLFGVGWSVGE